MADRIQARAIRRCGEILKEIEKAQRKHWKSKGDGADLSTSQLIQKSTGYHSSAMRLRLIAIILHALF
jgi:hypothetical protein